MKFHKHLDLVNLVDVLAPADPLPLYLAAALLLCDVAALSVRDFLHLRDASSQACQAQRYLRRSVDVDPSNVAVFYRTLNDDDFDSCLRICGIQVLNHIIVEIV